MIRALIDHTLNNRLLVVIAAVALPGGGAIGIPQQQVLERLSHLSVPGRLQRQIGSDFSRWDRSTGRRCIAAIRGTT